MELNKKWGLSCKLVKTENDAKALCAEIDAENSRYARKRYPTRYTPWTSRDNTEHVYIVWYHTKSGYCAI